VTRLFVLTCLTLFAFGSLADAQTTPIQQAEVRGSGGTTLVLIPGVNSDWTLWLDFMERNESRYTMHALTLPGFGGTPAPPETSEEGEPVSLLENSSKAVQQYLRENELEDAYLIGHGFGGQIALLAAAGEPERVEGVITVDGYPALFLGQPLTTEQRQQLVETRIEPQLRQIVPTQWRLGVRQIIDAAHPSPELKARLYAMQGRTNKGIGVRYALAYYGADIQDRLDEVEDPIYAMVSLPADRHPMLTPGFSTNLWNQQLKEAPGPLYLTLFENTSHFLMIHRPEAFDEMVAGFVAGKDVPRRLAFPDDEAPDQDAQGEAEGEPEGGGPGADEQPDEPG